MSDTLLRRQYDEMVAENARLTADLAAAREREQRLVDALSDLRRGCMVGSGRACRLCLGSWVDDETIEDHHPWCPMGATVELFRAAAAPAAEAREPRGEGDRFCLDCQTPLRTRVVARCYECVERNMLAREPRMCRCGRPLINPGEKDPWCEGCTMSAKTCDCVCARV